MTRPGSATVVLSIGRMSVLHREEVLWLDICAWTVGGGHGRGRGLEKMNFLPIQETVETYGRGTDGGRNGYCPRVGPPVHGGLRRRSGS